jgi:hypothetical protein
MQKYQIINSLNFTLFYLNIIFILSSFIFYSQKHSTNPYSPLQQREAKELLPKQLSKPHYNTTQSQIVKPLSLSNILRLLDGVKEGETRERELVWERKCEEKYKNIKKFSRKRILFSK